MDNNLISNKELIEMGYTFYNRKRLMVVPKSVVNEILGTEVA